MEEIIDESNLVDYSKLSTHELIRRLDNLLREQRCKQKKVYYTKASAQRARISNLTNKHMFRYRCEICGYWHLRSRKGPPVHKYIKIEGVDP